MSNQDKISIGESRNGKGLFAERLIKKSEKIIAFHGSMFTFYDLPNPYEAVADHYVQIGQEIYMGPSGKEDDLINHSCDPNSGLVIKDRKVYLFAIRDINKGEEITWDYSTTMDEDGWAIDCHCGSANCRREIRDFKYLPIDVKEKYIQLGIVPEYNLKYVSYATVNKQ